MFINIDEFINKTKDNIIDKITLHSELKNIKNKLIDLQIQTDKRLMNQNQDQEITYNFKLPTFTEESSED